MIALIDQLLELDRTATEATQDLRFDAATAFFTVITVTWLKTLIMLGAAVAADARAGRLRAPITTVAVAASVGIAARVEELLKQVFDRPRPPLSADVEPLIELPVSDSLPSGHALTAFAGAVALGALHPRLRWPALVFAVLVAASRPYLGVHFWLDVVIGAGVGAMLALAVVALLRSILAHHVTGPPGAPGRLEVRSEHG